MLYYGLNSYIYHALSVVKYILVAIGIRMPRNAKGNWTKVGPANVEGTSVKTSIPIYLVAKYRIEVGDTLEWDDDGEIMKVRRIDTKGIRTNFKGTRGKEK